MHRILMMALLAAAAIAGIGPDRSVAQGGCGGVLQPPCPTATPTPSPSATPAPERIRARVSLRGRRVIYMGVPRRELRQRVLTGKVSGIGDRAVNVELRYSSEGYGSGTIETAYVSNREPFEFDVDPETNIRYWLVVRRDEANVVGRSRPYDVTVLPSSYLGFVDNVPPVRLVFSSQTYAITSLRRPRVRPGGATTARLYTLARGDRFYRAHRYARLHDSCGGLLCKRRAVFRISSLRLLRTTRRFSVCVPGRLFAGIGEPPTGCPSRYEAR